MEKKQVKDLSVYHRHFDEDPSKFSDFQARDYVKELKNQGYTDQAIEVGKTFLEVLPEDSRGFVNHYCYALYNKYIKIDDAEIKEKESIFYSILDEILDTCKQEKYSPYEASVNRAVRYVLNNKPVDYVKLAELLDLLDPTLLDDRPFVNNSGKEFESRKEKWYRLRVRAYYEVKDFENCVETANVALTLTLKWHYSNLYWIRYYRAYSLVELERYEEAQNEFLSLKGRFIQVNFETLYRLYLNTGAKNDAYTNLLYEFFLSGYDYSNMKLYNYILDMVKEKEVDFIVKSASALIYKLNEENGKSVEVDADISQYEDKTSSQIFDTLYAQLMDHLDKFIERKESRVVYYNEEKEYGSLYVRGSDNIFFKQADYIYDEEVQQRDQVSYSVIKTYDNKKQRVATRAVLIKTLD